MSKKLTLEEFVEKARKVHGDKYDYSQVEYVNNRTNVLIICPIHGEFWQTPTNHLNGSGCLMCSGVAPLTTEEFVKRARKIHGDKYDYSKTDLNNRDEKGRVLIICPIHGEFKQKPSNHLNGKGCKKCKGFGLSNDERKEIASKLHNNFYDYSKSDFSNVKKNTTIICQIHGEFTMSYDKHVNGKCGCSECSGKKMLTKEQYIERAKEVYGDLYDYSQIEYKGMHGYIYPICKIHGKFKIQAQAHLRGQGCQKCHTYTLEEKVLKELEKENIDYMFQTNKRYFKWLNGLSLDFYIPSKNIAIECQGKQHFGEGGWFKNFDFKTQYKRDKMKYKLCEENNIRLLYYSNTQPKFEYFDKVYTDLNEIIKIIKDK